MKRINFFLFNILFFVLFIGRIAPLFSQEAKIQVTIKGSDIIVNARFLMWNCREIVYNALEQGLKSKIFFQIRIFEKAEGFFWFLGDRLVFEADPWYLGYIDFFENEYIIEASTGQMFRFKKKVDFFEYFLSLKDFAIEKIIENELSRYYMLLRIHLDSVRIVAPFTLLSLFSTEESFTTEWYRSNLKK